MLPRKTAITRWEVNKHVAAIAQDFRRKSRVALDDSGQSVRRHFEQEVWSKRYALSRGRGCFGLGSARDTG